MSEERQKSIRFGLAAIKNVGRNLAEAIVAEREKNGKFKSIEDFITRVSHKDLNKRTLESLIKSGALDCLGKREELLESVDLLLEFRKNQQRKKDNKQVDFLSLLGKKYTKIELRKPTKPLPEKKKLDWEKELLGVYVSNHPLKEYQKNLKDDCPSTNCREISSSKVSKIRVTGIISGIKKIITKTKESMLFVTLEDLTGKIEVLVFPSILKRTLDVWREDQIVIIDGHLSDKSRGEVKVLCDRVKQVVV